MERRPQDCAELRTELAALTNRVQDLEANRHPSRIPANSPLRRSVRRSVLVALITSVAVLIVTSLLYGQGAVQALFIDQLGRVGIGTTRPGAALDVTGKADVDGEVSLLLRSGNTARNASSNQITFSYNNTDTYRHAIKTRHNGSGVKGNAIDFYVWKYDPATVDPTVIGGLHTMTLDGGNVGIGKTSPNTKLDVAGTVTAEAFRTVSGVSLAGVQDAVNMLVPIGTMMAYGGNTGERNVAEQLRKQGWLPCDGAIVARKDYGELFQAIGTAFGGGDGQTSFQVPDLRGRFLRGTDQGQRRDPDATSRRAEPSGGNSGDQVGSVQDDQFRSHTHEYTQFPGNRGNIASGRYWQSRSAQTVPAGGSETRPKNVNVNWIIKVKHVLPLAQ